MQVNANRPQSFNIHQSERADQQINIVSQLLGITDINQTGFTKIIGHLNSQPMFYQSSLKTVSYTFKLIDFKKESDNEYVTLSFEPTSSAFAFYKNKNSKDDYETGLRSTFKIVLNQRRVNQFANENIYESDILIYNDTNKNKLVSHFDRLMQRTIVDTGLGSVTRTQAESLGSKIADDKTHFTGVYRDLSAWKVTSNDQRGKIGVNNQGYVNKQLIKSNVSFLYPITEAKEVTVRLKISDLFRNIVGELRNPIDNTQLFAAFIDQGYTHDQADYSSDEASLEDDVDSINEIQLYVNDGEQYLAEDSSDDEKSDDVKEFMQNLSLNDDKNS